MANRELTRHVWGNRWQALRDAPNRHGGQGQVWAVRDFTSTDRVIYALKLLDPKANKAKLDRFAREVEATQRLRTSVPGIVEIVDSHVSEARGGESFYVMPWASSTLKDQTGTLKGGAGLERTLELVALVGRTLAACHAAEPRVIHRDVKPANILLSREHTPILADFGICFLDEEDRLTHTQNDTLGSYGFTAPELFGGGATDDVGPAADIYSLGMTLYAVASGGRVFPLDRHRESTWELATATGDARLEHLHGLLDRMTALRVEDRFASMTECVAAIEHAIEHLQGGVRYAEGMYIGHSGAAQRMYRLRRDLGGPGTDAQHRAFVVALDASIARARQLAESAPASPPIGTGRSTGTYQVPEAIRTRIGAITDELLVPICATTAVGAQDVALTEEWVGRLAFEAEGDLYDNSARLFRAAVSIAVHVAGAVAWKCSYMVTLAALLRTHADHVREWNHLDMLSRDSTGVPQLVEHVVDHASAMNWLDAASRAGVRSAVAEYTGLLLLRDFQTSHLEVQRQLEAGELDGLDIPILPCLFFPHTEWTVRLGDDCAASKMRRQALARDVFSTSDEELRNMLHRFRLALIRLIARCNRERSMYHLGSPGYRLWGKWSLPTS